MDFRLKPFLDTRDISRLELAANIVTYPFQFCSRNRNRSLLLAANQDAAFARLVDILGTLQEKLSSHLPVTGAGVIWENREHYLGKLGLETTFLQSVEPALQRQVRETLDTMILEEVVGGIVNDAKPAPSSNEVLQLAAACAWLSDHVAMIVLGIASASADNDKRRITIVSASPAMARQLRRIWFGSAFEKQSLAASTAAIEAHAYAIANPRAAIGNRDMIRASALNVFPSQWRLPIEGPVAVLLLDHLIPLLRIVTNVVAAARQSGSPNPLTTEHAKALSAESTFHIIVEHQARIGIPDRLFNIVNGGLTLGTRSVGPGLLAICEELAASALGPSWHDAVSPYQKAYILERLSRSNHVEVIDLELRKHDTSNDVPLDVDFFVRDTRQGKLYAIQLKHIVSSDKGGLLFWIAQFRRRDSKLGKGVAQLESLRSLVADDPKVRGRLISNGLKRSELDEIVPILLHNIGPLDFWELQNGILLYDTGTFCNVLAGRSACFIAARHGKISTGATNGSPGMNPGPHDPDSTIASYVGDPDFKTLKEFDVAAKAIRTLRMEGESIIAEGLAI